VIARLHGVLLSVFGRLPRVVRRRIVRTIAPSFTVGAICVIERGDGHVVLIRQRYRNHWGLPGGLLARGESPEDAARREVREEIGLDVRLIGEPAVVVDADLRRVDVVFRAEPLDTAVAMGCTSVEIVAAEWHPLVRLPELQPETRSAIVALGFEMSPDR
jgi:8-oxo-dGTP diphosphatase